MAWGITTQASFPLTRSSSQWLWQPILSPVRTHLVRKGNVVFIRLPFQPFQKLRFAAASWIQASQTCWVLTADQESELVEEEPVCAKAPALSSEQINSNQRALQNPFPRQCVFPILLVVTSLTVPRPAFPKTILWQAHTLCLDGKKLWFVLREKRI